MTYPLVFSCRIWSWFEPIVYCDEETFIALGRSCLLANTRITASRSSSSWSWERNKELEHAWSYSVAHTLTHTLTRSHTHTHTQTNTLITIPSSSAFASPTRSRSLLSTTNISPWNHNREREGGGTEGRSMLVCCVAKCLWSYVKVSVYMLGGVCMLSIWVCVVPIVGMVVTTSPCREWWFCLQHLDQLKEKERRRNTASYSSPPLLTH